MFTKDVVKIIHQMAETGEPTTASGRAVEKSRDFIFPGAPLETRAVEYFEEREKINSAITIGRRSQHQILLKKPVVVAAMSFGALSKVAKLAIARASTMAGIADNTGEGGMLPQERELARFLIAQYSTARFGVTPEYLRAADAIEGKLSQGAKPREGGLLPGQKNTSEIAERRSTPEQIILPGQTLHSPANHPDIFTSEDLKKKVKWLREVTNGKPIIIKMAAVEIEKDIDFVLKAEPDIIAIDGREGGTGAAPRVMMDAVGIPTIPALVRARKHLDQLKWKKPWIKIPELWIGGGFNLGEDVAIALALGAEVVFLGFSLMIAMGCKYCQQCHLGKCPFGIATQDPEVMRNYYEKEYKSKDEFSQLDYSEIEKIDIDRKAQRVANYLQALTEEVKMIAAAYGLWDIYDLNKTHLRTYDPYLARQVGIKTVWEGSKK